MKEKSSWIFFRSVITGILYCKQFKMKGELKSLVYIFVVFYGDFWVSHEFLESKIFRSKSLLSIKNKKIDLLISIIWETIPRIWNLPKITALAMICPPNILHKRTIMGIFNVKQVYVFQAFKISGGGELAKSLKIE